MHKMIENLLNWYQNSTRTLPWRSDPTPYHVWLSEIMLQQTQISAVIPYYHRFLETFPTIASLAIAKEDVLLKCWEGLGYYRRARNLKRGAEQVMLAYGGSLPKEAKELEKIHGIGKYTAGAIASIAFHQRSSAVDGNVLRVYTRLMGDSRNITEEKNKREIAKEIEAWYPEEGIACRYTTEALMELGQLLCVPRGEVRCLACPLASFCSAYKEKKQLNYPVKASKKERKIIKKTVFLFYASGKYAILKRPDTGLLASLWEFPNVDRHLTSEEALAVCEGFGLKPQGMPKKLPASKHIFTHLEWHMEAYRIDVLPSTQETMAKAFTFASLDALQTTFAIASAFKAYRP